MRQQVKEMKEFEKEVQQAFLDEEKRVLGKLEDSYAEALIDINNKIDMLLARDDAELSNVIYQVEYQRSLKTQVQAVLEQLQVNEFDTISEYLTNSYNNGFIGAMYSMHQQGVSLVIPINPAQVVEAIRHETKLTASLYTELGLDIKELQKKIAGEISRGISSGQGYGDIARNIAAYAKIPMNNAMRIARTESHRIQCKSAMDAQYGARDKGADVVKQWDSTLDGNTRPHHRRLDGQIRELDEPFEVSGMKAMYPGDFGKASEDCNCRCALLQRARWALDEEELAELQERAEYFGLDKTEDFDDYRNRYLQASNGLSADENKVGFIPEHQEPDFIGQIDYNDRDAVNSAIKSFEEDAIKENIETACVITRSGEIYKCYGIGDAVFPDYDLGDKIIGATISHNHPIEYTQYSFGKTDFLLFEEYNLDCLRGIDIKYGYEFNRYSDHVDEHIGLFEMTDEDYAHEESISRAERAKIGYTRWLND